MKAGFTGLGALAVAAGLSTFGAAAFELPKVGLPDWFGGDSKNETLAPGATADCPVIVKEDGSHMIRSPAGAEAAAVHHQLSIKSTARECIVEGDHLTIRVGIEGDAMLGPAGAPGAYGGAIRVALRRTKDDSIVSSKTYRVSATIPSGGARADFRLLADPLVAPTVAKAQEDYEILVGFTDGAATNDAPVHKKKKGRR